MSLYWQIPEEFSEPERRVLRHCKAKKLYAFLRQQRRQIFDDAFQGELIGMYGPQVPGGSEPVARRFCAW